MLRQSHLRIARHRSETKIAKKGKGSNPSPFLVVKTYKVNGPIWFLPRLFARVPYQELELYPS